jgi:metal-dependent amidase/aminoacylase/carboxypeptidase family protein
VEVEFSGAATTMKHNRVLASRWVANAEAYGIIDQGMDPTSGSTDMANVSWAVPAIHPDLAITDVPTPGHSIEFREAAARPRADRTVLLAATLVAETALDLLLDPALVAEAWREFRGEG